MEHYIKWLHELGMDDLDQVGGKNASFGEMIGSLAPLGVTVPDGFAITADAYRALLEGPGVRERLMRAAGRNTTPHP